MYDERVVTPMREELTRFTGYVMSQGDGKLETLLTAPFTIANQALANLYGAKATGDWQKVDLDPTKRSGILTQSAFLATHGHEGSAPGGPSPAAVGIGASKTAESFRIICPNC